MEEFLEENLFFEDIETRMGEFVFNGIEMERIREYFDIGRECKSFFLTIDGEVYGSSESTPCATTPMIYIGLYW